MGATEDLQIESIGVEQGPVKDFLHKTGTKWIFNPPHSSHMGGVWERMIGVTRRILDSMLLDTSKNPLTHEVLTTFMAEACAIINARPIVPVSTDPQSPFVLSPAALLTQKTNHTTTFAENLEIRDMYRAQWKGVQVMANTFWQRWKDEYLSTLQKRRKWQETHEDIKNGDIILLKEKSAARNDWPMGIVTQALPGTDGKVRKAVICMTRDGTSTTLTRPITDLVLLCSGPSDTGDV